MSNIKIYVSNQNEDEKDNYKFHTISKLSERATPLDGQTAFVLKSDYDAEIQAANEVVRSLSYMMNTFKKVAEFYADKNNWSSAYCVAPHAIVNQDDIEDGVETWNARYGGKFAREVLKEALKLEGDL